MFILRIESPIHDGLVSSNHNDNRIMLPRPLLHGVSHAWSSFNKLPLFHNSQERNILNKDANMPSISNHFGVNRNLAQCLLVRLVRIQSPQPSSTTFSFNSFISIFGDFKAAKVFIFLYLTSPRVGLPGVCTILG